jgi:hypothetical protein
VPDADAVADAFGASTFAVGVTAVVVFESESRCADAAVSAGGAGTLAGEDGAVAAGAAIAVLVWFCRTAR